MANRQVVDLSRGYELADGGALGVPWDPRCMDSVGILLETPIFRDLSVRTSKSCCPTCASAGMPAASRSGSRATAQVMIVLAEGQLKAHRVSRDGREVIVEVFGGSRSPAVGLFHPVGIRWLSLSAMTAARCLSLRRAPLLGFLAGIQPPCSGCWSN